jgi:hypothetical protein
MNFETSLLSYFGSEITGRSGTSLRLGIHAPYFAIGYWLLVIWFLKADRKPLLNLPDNLGYDTSINK